jgi:hypothetical protein
MLPNERPGAGKRRVVLPTAALLLAATSVLTLMATNLRQTSFPDVAPSLAGAIGFAALAWIATVLARRRADAASAVIACLWTVVWLFHVDLFGDLNGRLDGWHPMLASLPFAVAALLLGTAAVHWLRLPWTPVHLVLTGVGFVTLAPPLWQAAAYEWRHGKERSIYDAVRATEELPELAERVPVAPDARPPDIYHFIFDRYGSAETLSRVYGIDRRIDGFLAERGFYVATESFSNYQKTGQSLASTFHMDYLDVLAESPIRDGGNWGPIFAMLDDHRVGRFLRARDYRHLQFGSWWAGTHRSSAADENHPHGFSEFGMQHLRRTMLRPLFHALPRTPFTMRLDWDNAQCQRVARQVEQIKRIGVRDDPVYVFAHILVPHGPFVFAPDGRCLTQREAAARGDWQGYIDQIAYADRIIEDVVATLQERDGPPPIILIQADEGPVEARDNRIPWQEAPSEELRVKLGILNAVYFPGGDYDLLRSDVTPVNSYRMLFNTYFGTEFPILADRIFAFPDDLTLYEYHDVTDRVRNGVAAGEGPVPGADGIRPAAPAPERFD